MNFVVCFILSVFVISAIASQESDRKKLSLSCVKYLDTFTVQPHYEDSERENQIKIEAMQSTCSMFPDMVVQKECKKFKIACGVK